MTIPLRRRVFYCCNAVRRVFEDIVARTGLSGGGTPVPPAIKRRTVREYAARYSAVDFVETGTYLGEMTASMLRRFEHLYSIELSDVLFKKAVTRFARHANVKILHGDSATLIGRVLPECTGRTLFWLDAHWSGGITARGNTDTPIVDELDQILGGATGDPVILVDDARCFVGRNGYPTIEELRERVARLRPAYTLTVDRDIIRIVPPSPRHE